VLERSAQRILDRVGSADLVLDIGGWWRPFTRADWVMDIMPWETRGHYGHQGPLPERFDRDRWIQRDICDREPYPFGDKEVDFVICSHTLEDVRDPVWVCAEMTRIAKAGYIEVPSRLEEQSYGVQGPWAGWGHHRWLIDVTAGGATEGGHPASGGRIDFVFKHHVLHNRDSDHFPRGFFESVPPEQRVSTLWWESSFEFGERVFISPDELDAYLAEFVERHRDEFPRGSTVSRALARLSRRRWRPGP
jgi:Methyltransferase domain